METDNVGPLYGVHMVVNTEPLEKGKTYGSSGLKVILHQHEELPLKRVGFHVPPGYVTYVDMKKQKVFFLLFPSYLSLQLLLVCTWTIIFTIANSIIMHVMKEVRGEFSS